VSQIMQFQRIEAKVQWQGKVGGMREPRRLITRRIFCRVWNDCDENL